MNRYRRETELRNKNKFLESAKNELSLKVEEMQVGGKLGFCYYAMNQVEYGQFLQFSNSN